MLPHRCKKCYIYRSYYTTNTNLTCRVHSKIKKNGRCSRCGHDPNYSNCYHSWSNSPIHLILINLGF